MLRKQTHFNPSQWAEVCGPVLCLSAMFCLEQFAVFSCLPPFNTAAHHKPETIFSLLNVSTVTTEVIEQFVAQSRTILKHLHRLDLSATNPVRPERSDWIVFSEHVRNLPGS